MSSVGKKSLFDRVKSLFRKEQATSPSQSQPSSQQKNLLPARELSTEESKQIAALVQAWVNRKGYRLPHRTIEEAAEDIGTTSVILHRYCINCLGEDFRSWRTNLRIEDAKKLLAQEPELSASKVARIVGINDRSNFFRQFSAITGYTPEQWKQKHSKA